MTKGTKRKSRLRSLAVFLVTAPITGVLLLAALFALQEGQVAAAASRALRAAAESGTHAEVSEFSGLSVTMAMVPSGLESPEWGEMLEEHASTPLGACLEWVREHPEEALKKEPTLVFDDNGVFFLLLAQGPLYADSRLSNPSVPVYATDVTLVSSILHHTIVPIGIGALVLSAALIGVGLDLTRRTCRAERQAAELFANASHELRTPLAVIGAEAALLDREEAEPRQVGRHIEHQVHRMGILVDGILQLSKVDAQPPHPEFAAMDLRETVYDALATVEPLAAERGVELTVGLDRQMPVTSDARMTHTVLLNVLANAVRHARTQVTLTGCGGTTVLVANDGEPLGQEQLERLFDRFWSDSDGGCGIGMALAEEYANALGAKLELYNEGRHVVARFSLPYQESRTAPM